MVRPSTRNLLLIVAASVLPMFAFQNCSQVHFADMNGGASDKAGFINDIQPNAPADVINNDVNPPADNQVVSNDLPKDDSTTTTTDTSKDDDGSKSYDDTAKNDDDSKKDDSYTPKYDSNSDSTETAKNDDDSKKDDSSYTPKYDSNSSSTETVKSDEDPKKDCVADASATTMVTRECKGGETCAVVCFIPNDKHGPKLTKVVSLDQYAHAWAPGPKSQGKSTGFVVDGDCDAPPAPACEM